MANSPNIALVRKLYDSGMASEVGSRITAPGLVWDITPGFPHSGTFHSWDGWRPARSASMRVLG